MPTGRHKSYCTLKADCYSPCESFLKGSRGIESTKRRTAWRISLPIPALAARLRVEVSRGHDQRQVEELYVIHPEGCIDCGVCAIYCPVSCIQDQYGNLVTRIKPSQIPKALSHRG